MRYFLDTEFNGEGGELISLALVREDGASVYVVVPASDEIAPWVKENVLPVLQIVPPHVEVLFRDRYPAALVLSYLLRADKMPVIVSDWIVDIEHLCALLKTGSVWWDMDDGPMKPLPSLRFEVVRVGAYPTKLLGAIQHNAWWDAMALRFKLTGKQTTKRRIYGEQTLHAGTCWVSA